MIDIKKFLDSLTKEQLDELEKEIIKRKNKLVDKNDINTFTVKFFDKYLNFICSQNKLLGYIDNSLLVGTIIDKTHIEFINLYEENGEIWKYFCTINLEKNILDVDNLKKVNNEDVIGQLENINNSIDTIDFLDNYDENIYNDFLYLKNKYSDNMYINYINNIVSNHFNKKEKSR